MDFLRPAVRDEDGDERGMKNVRTIEKWAKVDTVISAKKAVWTKSNQTPRQDNDS